MSEKRKIALLGSTGSIGTQALQVIREQRDLLEVEVLIANSNADLLIEQARQCEPNAVVIADESKYLYVKENLSDTYVKVYAGKEAIDEIVTMDTIDMVLTATVGFSGLSPTLSAIQAGKTIALANKETLVVAGEIVCKLAQEKAINILPVDSEHSAIFQCLAGEFQNKIEKIILTASGGPFRGKTQADLQHITKAQALKHPNWTMGAKITIDSATLMNKGLECIEAQWLFALKPEQIEVIVHPQSIIHSLVQFQDGSLKAQMGLPDMKLPIQYAFTYPKRQPNTYPRFSFSDYKQLSFEEVDTNTFQCLDLAFQAMHKGGNMPCILNAANEIAVQLFLQDKITFLQIPALIHQAMQKISYIPKPTLQDLFDTDTETRILSQELLFLK